MADASDTANKAIDLLNKAGDGVANVASQLESLIKAHAGDAWDLAMAASRIDALEKLSYGAQFLLLAGIGGIILPRVWKLAKAALERSDDAPQILWVVSTVTSLVAIVIGCIGVVMNLFNVWAWVGLFQPNLWLAHQLLLKLASGS